ncbi:MAG: CocE/NonD family hydrolase, partial [Spongiibacteraceae bacterium]
MSIACLLGSLLQLAACTENADGSYATAQTESVAASNYQTQTSSSVDAQGQAKMAAWVPQPETYDIGTQNNLTVPMKDGTILRVMVKYPVDRTTGAPAVGAFPALLTQTPYGKNSPLYTTLGGGSEDYLVKRGYIAVVADVRGRGASEGEFDFWGYQERLDSLELADWAARLPNSNGKVGLFGGSYMGITQLHTASVAGPNSPIKAAIPEVVISNVGRDGYYGGMPNLGFGLLYAVLFPTTGLTGIIDYIGVNDPGDLLTRTQQALSGSLSVAAPLVLDQVLDGPAAHAGEFWDFRSPGTNLDDIANSGIAIMLVGGWYDVMGKGPSMIYTGLQNASAGRPVGLPMKADQIPNPRYQWLQGPWTHTGTMPSDLVAQVRLRWFDRWLKNVDNGIDQTSTPIHFNVLGTDRWVDAKTWPLKETTSTVFYFGGRGHSNAPSLNDGSLSSIKPVDALASDQVFWTGVSSPCSVRLKIQTAGLLEMIPVPLDEKVCGSGSEETTQLGALTYTTEPFASDKVIAGPIGLTLYASSSGFDAE